MNEFLTKVLKPMIRVEYRVKGVLKRRDYVHKRDAIKCLAHWVIIDHLDDEDEVHAEHYKGDVVELLKSHASIDLIHDFIDSFDLESAVYEERMRWQSGVDEIPF